jgi:hypothetical protein
VANATRRNRTTTITIIITVAAAAAVSVSLLVIVAVCVSLPGAPHSVARGRDSLGNHLQCYIAHGNNDREILKRYIAHRNNLTRSRVAATPLETT